MPRGTGAAVTTKDSAEAASDGGADKKNPCQALACAIQDCLAANNYQEEKCKSVIQRWEQCVSSQQHQQQNNAAANK